MNQKPYWIGIFAVAALSAVTFVARAQVDTNLAGTNATVDQYLRITALYSDVGEVRANVAMRDIDSALQGFFAGNDDETSRRRLVELVGRYVGVYIPAGATDYAVRSGLIQSAIRPGRVDVRSQSSLAGQAGYAVTASGLRPVFEWFYSGTPGVGGRFPLITTEGLRPAIPEGAPIAPELVPFAEFLVGSCQYRFSPSGEAWRGRDGSWLVAFGAEAEVRGCDGFLRRAPVALPQFLPGSDSSGVGSLMRPLEAHGIYRPNYLENLRRLKVHVVMQVR